MLKYKIINKENKEIRIEMLEFPQELYFFLKKKLIFTSKEDVIIGVISKSLLIDNIGRSNMENVSITIPLSHLIDFHKKETEPLDGNGGSGIKYSSERESILIIRLLMSALNQLCEEALGLQMLIETTTSNTNKLLTPHVPKKVPFLLM